MVVYGGYGSCSGTYCADAAAYDPAANTWVPLTPPSADLDGRYYHVGLSTGSTSSPTATFWGGYGAYVSSSYYRNTGAMFDPTPPGTWKSIVAPSDTVMPNSRRQQAVAWWTGAEMFFWGGYNGSTFLSNGAFYDPSTSTWKSMSDSNAPVARALATAVWTGAEAIVWGGATSTTSSSSYTRNDGKIYRP
jgi:N-acetylneuraminic acid mutarotase